MSTRLGQPDFGHPTDVARAVVPGIVEARLLKDRPVRRQLRASGHQEVARVSAGHCGRRLRIRGGGHDVRREKLDCVRVSLQTSWPPISSSNSAAAMASGLAPSVWWRKSCVAVKSGGFGVANFGQDRRSRPGQTHCSSPSSPQQSSAVSGLSGGLCPARILDLFAEFRNHVNGMVKERSLIDALTLLRPRHHRRPLQKGDDRSRSSAVDLGRRRNVKTFSNTVRATSTLSNVCCR